MFEVIIRGCVYLCVCVYVCVYAYVCVCVYVCARARPHAFVSVRVRICLCGHANLGCACERALVCMCA